MSKIPERRKEARAHSRRSRMGNIESDDGEAHERHRPTRTEGGALAGKTSISCISCRKRKLRCDRIKPECGACTRFRRECEYPQRKSNLGAKAERIMELEDRVAELEAMLVLDSKIASTAQSFPDSNIETNWDTFGMGMLDGDIPDTNFIIPQNEMDYQTLGTIGDFVPQELLPLGLQEPLPEQAMRDELHAIYFEKIHPTIPMIHKLRYYTSFDLAPHMRPPASLQYAIWAVAALNSDTYLYYADMLYERARRYIDEAELKGYGEESVSLYHAQAWGLIAAFESKKTYMSRAWMSTGRMTRLVHMLQLHKLDVVISEDYTMPPQDWIQLEERRRTFWAAYYSDRWSSFGSGWPMLIQEEEIMTNLPGSVESFEHGTVERTVSLKEALTPEGAAKVSSYGGVMVSIALFSHSFQHLRHVGPNERLNDLDGDFWKRHRKINNLATQIFMILPNHLKLPAGSRDMNVITLHMNIHASHICLHEAAISMARRHRLDPGLIRRSRAQSLVAAEEIAGIMRLISHIDASSLTSCMGTCLYIAAKVFIQHSKSDDSRLQSISNLEFIIAAMYAIGKRHPITSHFTAQLELDIEAAGIDKPSNFPPNNKKTTTGTLVDGLFAERQGVQ